MRTSLRVNNSGSRLDNTCLLQSKNMEKTFIKAILIFILTIIVCIMSAYSVSAVSVNSATGQINVKNKVKLRTQANLSDKSKIVAKIKNDTKVEIKKEIFKSKTSTSDTDRWYYIELNGQMGYVQAKYIDNIKYTSVYAWVKADTNYRVGAGTKMNLKGSFVKDEVIKVCLNAKPVSSTKGSSATWYKVKVGTKYYFATSKNIKLMTSSNIYENMNDDEFVTYLKEQGFNTSYRKKLKALHKKHPNWEFVGKKMEPKWNDAVIAQRTPTKVSQIQRSGSSNWVVANKKEVSYYLDPRNFVNETYIFMFENLNYNSKYQTKSVVNQILKNTFLEKYEFKPEYFVTYGKAYNISPVHLASRARQETGGTDGPAIKGMKFSPDLTSKKKKVYNPFNIGATSSVNGGLKYAYEQCWNTQEKSVEGGAKLLAEGYISAGQNTLYFEKFNFKNGKASHQYMANIKAPYSEANITYHSYKDVKILSKAFSFVIPIYTDMPDSTAL